MLSGLKNMALDMGDTLESQNTQIDRINDKTEQNELRVDKANSRAQKMLKGEPKKK
jgi:synaptosomal-associated protein 25